VIKYHGSTRIGPTRRIIEELLSELNDVNEKISIQQQSAERLSKSAEELRRKGNSFIIKIMNLMVFCKNRKQDSNR
jgi:hypothetical protein